MNLIQIQKHYGTKAQCLTYLEKVRWDKSVCCIKCGSISIVRLKKQVGRYHCNSCKTTFSVISDTIFENSRLPLPKWFMIIGLMLHAKRGISASQIHNSVGITYKTAWYACMRIRCAMIDHCNIELENVVEMDEAYIGGKPRYKKNHDSDPNLAGGSITNKRGRGTKKTPIVGIVERNGNVVLKVVEKLTTRNLMAMLKDFVKTDKSILVTDEFPSYKKFDKIIQHYTVNHGKKEYVKGMMHTNTIEGFFSIIKNSIKGSYIAVSKKYLPLYLVQSQYIFNQRNESENLFDKLLKEAVNHENPMLHYKPIKSTKEIVYKNKKC